MEDTQNDLKDKIQQHFSGHGQRKALLVKLLIALIKVTTVCFSGLALALPGDVTKGAKFKRIQRFFRYFKFIEREYINFVWSVALKSSTSKLTLHLDRTNWDYGLTKTNILLVGISWKGTSIPLIWCLLGKKGNSNQGERIALMKRLFDNMSPEKRKQVATLVGDREFIGQKWFTWLKKEKVCFVFRIPKSAKVICGNGKERKASSVFASTRFKNLTKGRQIYNHKLYVCGKKLKSRLKKDEYFILVSNEPLEHARETYAKRWGIEVLFGTLKTRGFNFEDTRVRASERIETMIFVLSIAHIWVLVTGEWLIENKGCKIRTVKIKKRVTKLYSIFRHGLDYIRERLLNNRPVTEAVNLLSCT